MERGRKRGREEGREGEREKERERGREGERERGKEGEREKEREGGRERLRKNTWKKYANLIDVGIRQKSGDVQSCKMGRSVFPLSGQLQHTHKNKN